MLVFNVSFVEVAVALIQYTGL